MAEQSKEAGNGGSGAGDEGAAAAGPFAFDAVSEAEIAKVLAAYPPGRQASAAVPLLHLVQRQMARTTGSAWVPPAAVAEVARRLGMAPVRVQELVSFYTMFATRPVGRYHLQVCTTTPCWLRGSDEVVRACRKATGIAGWGDSADGLFTLSEVECLGACVNAPVLQVNEDTYEELDAASTERLVEALRRGERPPPGPLSAANKTPAE